MGRSRPTYGVQAQYRVAIFDCPYGVPPTSTNLTLDSDTIIQSARGDITNAEFLQSIHLLTQLVTSQSCQMGSTVIAGSPSEATKVG